MLTRFSLAAYMAALAIAGAAAAGSILVAYRIHSLNVSGKSFVERTVNVLATSGDEKEILIHATAALRATQHQTDAAALANATEQLGTFQRYFGTAGSVNVTSVLWPGTPISGNYETHARFVNGLAAFHFKLVRSRGAWMIDDFHIDGELLGSPGPGLMPSVPLKADD